MVEKKPRPTKEMSAKLFAGGSSPRPKLTSPGSGSVPTGGGAAGKKSFELKGQEAGLVRSTDVFSDGAAFGTGERAAPIVDWDAMAAHARTAANNRLTLADIFGGGRFYLISRPILVALAAGIIGGMFISAFGYYTDRIPYTAYSTKGYELLQSKNARPAVEYFLAQSNATEIATFPGSPYHIASLEALAESYAVDKCYSSAEDTFRRVIRLLYNAPFRDDVRLANALEHYGDFLRGQDRPHDAEAVMREVKDLRARNTGAHWIWFFAVLAFAFEGIYMSGVLLSGKRKMENWMVYGGFTVLGMVGMTVGFFKLGCPIGGALGASMAIAYLVFPSILVMACAVGKNMPAFHVLMPSRKRK
ncbi:MAG: hypothetical protein JSS83_05885 [Cyanobacteria bacterium SZAS LIN-3]|nr:hypothetical protein [Cyanobacteria bacterium SZAS LIN-3]